MKRRNLTVADEMGLNNCIDFSEKIVFATSNDSSIGVGAILILPYNDILEVYREEEEEILYFKVKTTEGEQVYSVLDFLVVSFSPAKK